MTPSEADEPLPELTFDLATQIGEFHEFEYTVLEEDVRRYRSALGLEQQDGPITVPGGFAAIFGRLGYLKNHRMPPGGVLLGQDVLWHAPAIVGEPMLIGARVVEATQREDRRKLVFLTTARQHGRTVAEVRIVAGWPK